MTDVDRRRAAPTGLVRRALAVGALIAFFASLWSVSGASAAAPLRVAARIDGHALAGRSRVAIHPDRPTELQIDVTNTGSAPVTVRTIALGARVMGLTFFSHQTSVDIGVDPGSTESRRYLLDLRSLDGQATGLMPGEVTLLDDDRHELAGQDFTADIDGSIWSVYGLFGFAALLLTALALAAVLLALARQRLPFNRARRGLRFALVGIGLGVAAVFILSVLRIVVPITSWWLPVLAVTTFIAFGIGYLTPNPDEIGPPAHDPDLDDRDRRDPGGHEPVRVDR